MDIDDDFAYDSDETESSFFSGYGSGSFTVNASSESISHTNTTSIFGWIAQSLHNARHSQTSDDFETNTDSTLSEEISEEIESHISFPWKPQAQAVHEVNQNKKSYNFEKNINSSLSQKSSDFENNTNSSASLNKESSKEIKPDVGFPWKRLIFWGLMISLMCIPGSPEVDFGFLARITVLSSLAWMMGLIYPKFVFTFGLANTRASVNQIYFSSFMLIAYVAPGETSAWEGALAWLGTLWFLGIINPKITINFGLNTRVKISMLYILLILGVATLWGAFKAVSGQVLY